MRPRRRPISSSVSRSRRAASAWSASMPVAARIRRTRSDGGVRCCARASRTRHRLAATEPQGRARDLVGIRRERWARARCSPAAARSPSRSARSASVESSHAARAGRRRPRHERREQAPRARRAARPGDRRCEADCSRARAPRLHHGEAVAGAPSVAEEQRDVRALARGHPAISRGTGDRAVEECARAGEIMALLCEVRCGDEQPRRSRRASDQGRRAPPRGRRARVARAARKAAGILGIVAATASGPRARGIASAAARPSAARG